MNELTYIKAMDFLATLVQIRGHLDNITDNYDLDNMTNEQAKVLALYNTVNDFYIEMNTEENIELTDKLFSELPFGA